MQDYNDSFMYVDPFSTPDPVFDEDGNPMRPSSEPAGPTDPSDPEYYSSEDELPF